MVNVMTDRRCITYPMHDLQLPLRHCRLVLRFSLLLILSILLHSHPPGLTSLSPGIDLDSDIIATLAQHPNIVGTKLSCGNIGKLHRLTSSPHVTPETFAVFPGQSAVMLHGMLSGGSGVIAALPNLLPKVHMKLYRGWSDSKNVTDLKPLIDLQAKLGHADWAVGKLGGVGGLKALVSAHFGYGAPWVRGPLGSGDIEKVKGLLEKDEEGGEWNTLRELIEMEKRL
jgi:4-hydroxy-2-oxoglutarate aldolase